MAGRIVTERKNKMDTPALAIGGRFGKFGPEEEKASRKAEVKETEAVRQMKEVWKLNPDYNGNVAYYGCILAAIKDLRFTAKDVEKFSLALVEFQFEDKFYWKAGLFLSALINSGEDSDYMIHTQHLAVLPRWLGYKNEKNIIVNGNAGDCVGERMKGGRITVKGNAGGWVGNEMKGGSIIVNGNAACTVGYRMKGGEIWLEGDYESLTRYIDWGRIYHKGRLIAGE
jgi:formylmethanofuran dehydrogenase subunit C